MGHALATALICFGLFGTLQAHSSLGQDPADVRLTPGQALEREMAVGETHRYSVELRAGEYLQLLVEQRGVDVAQKLVAPDGQVVLETDTPGGPIGPDPLAFTAVVGGDYQLSLRAAAVAIAPRGRYELRVEAVREPMAADLLRARTVRANIDAYRVFRKQPAVALDGFREVLAGWQALGDRRMELWTELMVGYLHSAAFDQYAESLERFQHALALALEMRDEWAEARVLQDLAQTQRRLGRLDEARASLERSLSLHRAAGRREFAARCLMSLGTLFSLAGEPQDALDRLQEALRDFQAEGNGLFTGMTRLQMGAVHLGLRDPEPALEQFQTALAAFPLLEQERARAIAGIGAARYQLGQLALAREAYSEALSIHRMHGNRIQEADTLLNLGDLYRDEGDLEAAARVFTNALETYRSGAYVLGEGNAQCGLGEVQRRMGNLEAAQSVFAAALALAPRASAHVSVCAQQGLAQAARDIGDLDAAQAHAEAALERLESLRTDVVSYSTRSAALASHQALYELLIAVLMRRHGAQPSAGLDVAAFEVGERARARVLLELLAEGHTDVREGVDPVLLAEEGSLRRSLSTLAQEETQALAAGRADRAEAVGRDLSRVLAGLGEIEGRIRRASPRYAALTHPRPLKLADIRERVLDRDTQLLQYTLGEEGSYLWVVSSDRFESFHLAAGTKIEAAARRVHELMSAPATANGHEGTSSGLAAARRQLSRLVLAPAAGALTARRLLVVAPGALQYVPLASLPLPDETLVLSRFEVISAPSSSVIATLRAESSQRARAAKEVAVFADPVFDYSDPRLAAARGGATAPARVALRSAPSGEALEQALHGLRGRGAGGGLGRLPFSRREADAIVSLAGRKRVLAATGFDANRSAVTAARLADYRILHFATHGVLNTRRPELSGVVLSLLDDQGRGVDGFLRLHDVYDLKLAADLVVLSGCQTALGKEMRGEGLIGLTRGFMYAGANAVVASLWQVDDESTAELMKRFYRGMLKENRRPADALRAAQLEMSRQKRWSAPFYWAGFVLQGEWR